MINEELPAQKIKQIEGKYKILDNINYDKLAK